MLDRCTNKSSSSAGKDYEFDDEPKKETRNFVTIDQTCAFDRKLEKSF